MTNIGPVGLRRWGHTIISGTIKELNKHEPGKYFFHATRRNIVEFCSEALGGQLYFPEAKPLFVADVADAAILPDEISLEGYLPGRIAQRIAGGSSETFGLGVAGIDSVLDIVAVAYQGVLSPKEYNRVLLLRDIYAKSFRDEPVPWILRASWDKLASLIANRTVKVVSQRDLRYSDGIFSEFSFAGRFSLSDFEVFAEPDPKELTFNSLG
ncbi:MAG: hypothetical protein WCW67_07410 [Candidatus Margulisiibacteriota bacterium]|jgi:hypothetical protein